MAPLILDDFADSLASGLLVGPIQTGNKTTQ